MTEDKPLAANENEAARNQAQRQIDDFRSRASRLKQQANAVLFLGVFPLLVAAVGVFIFAATIVSRDQTVALRALTSELSNQEEGTFQTSALVATLDRLTTVLGETVLQEAQSPEEDIFRQLASINQQLGEITKSAGEINTQNKERTDTLKKMFEKFSLYEPESVAVPTLLQTNIIRFGTIGIIIFAISLLMRLYQYTRRLASFYDARADAMELVLIGWDLDGLKAVVDAMTPTFDFGQLPSSPTKEAVDLAKRILDRR